MTQIRNICIFALLLIMPVYSQDIEVKFTPANGAPGVSRTFTGTLTDVVAQFNALPNGTELGWCECTYKAPVTYKTGAAKQTGPCCPAGDHPPAAGHAYTVAKADLIVNVEGSDAISIPAWTPRMPNPLCASASNEWNRWVGLITTHENHHDADNTALFTKANITPLLKLSDVTTKCYSDADLPTKGTQDLYKQLQDIETQNDAAIDTAVTKASDAFHATPAGGPIGPPDGSKKCP